MSILDIVPTPFRKQSPENESHIDTNTSEYDLKELDAQLAEVIIEGKKASFRELASIDTVRHEIETALKEPTDKIKRDLAYSAIKSLEKAAFGATRLYEAYENAQISNITLDESLKEFSDPRYEFLYDPNVPFEYRSVKH